MNPFPKEGVVIMWRKGVGGMTKGEDTKHLVGIGDVEDATNDVGGGSGIAETTAADLHPAGGDTEGMSLILHGDGSDGTILDPAVVLSGVAQNDHGEGGLGQHRGALLFGIGKFFKVALVINDDKVPGTLVT